MAACRITRNAFLIWALLGLLAVVDAAGLTAMGMSLTPSALLLIFMPVAGGAALAWFYTYVRPDRRIAALTHIAAATLASMSTTCILSYLAAALDRPLIDSSLVAADRALGLNWLAMYRWIVGHPWLHMSMKPVYLCLVPQIIVVQVALCFRGQVVRAWESLWIFVLTCLACVAVSGIWPAAGAFSFFHVEPNEPYLHEFAALRDGSLKVIGAKGGLQGVVEFPSLHMALAILFPYALRGIPVLFPIIAVLDGLVAITTPVVGGHHFADLWGGAVLALAVIGLARRKFMQRLFAGASDMKSVQRKKNAGRSQGSSRVNLTETSKIKARR